MEREVRPFLFQCKCQEYTVPLRLRKIRLIECNAKCRYLKNWHVKGLCGRCVICMRPPPLLWPHYPPFYTLHGTVYLFTQGKGGGLTREKVRGAIVHKKPVKNTNMSDQKLYLTTEKTTFRVWCLYCYIVLQLRGMHCAGRHPRWTGRWTGMRKRKRVRRKRNRNQFPQLWYVSVFDGWWYTCTVPLVWLEMFLSMFRIRKFLGLLKPSINRQKKYENLTSRVLWLFNNFLSLKKKLLISSLGRYVFGSEISYNKAPPRLPGLAC